MVERQPPQGESVKLSIKATLEEFRRLIKRLNAVLMTDINAPVEFIPWEGKLYDKDSVFWHVRAKRKAWRGTRFGSIFAEHRASSGDLWIEFSLAKFPDPSVFWRMVDEVIEEMKRRGFEPLADSGAVGEEAALPLGFPTSEGGRARAKKVWVMAKQIEQEWFRDHGLGYKDPPAPLDSDLLYAINERVKGKKYKSAKRIRDFMKWGDAGLLK